ncbi:MAG: hypothetical protein LBK06_00820 [Planctomycetaceae bacterium]|jgi:hypothetical protein|nr:hypothetical protein [Planctomycetaceae bacterium]
MKIIKMTLDFLGHRNRFFVARYVARAMIIFVFSLFLTTAAALCQEKKEEVEEVFEQGITFIFVSNEGLTHRVVFGAKDGFKAERFVDVFNIYNEARNNAQVKWMFTTIDKDEKGNQVFIALTDDPEAVRKIIETLPKLVYIKSEPLTIDKYEKHMTPWSKEITTKPQSELDKLVWETLGISYTPMPIDVYKRNFAQYLNEFPNGGVVVNAVREGSLFAEYGVLAGDVIVGIHSWSVTSQKDVRFIAKEWQKLRVPDNAVKVEFFRKDVRHHTKSRQNNSDKSIKDMLKEIVKESYRVDKRIIDFPEKFDLSTPETAYVTQKQLIVSKSKDKFEQLAKMNFYGGGIPERERRREAEITEDWAKIYKTEFVVYEVLKIRDDVAVVFSLRQFDKLYDANVFQKKDDGLWYNRGNLQNHSIDGMVNDVKRAATRALSPIQHSVTSIKDKLKSITKESYRVDKRIIDFPEKFDLSTPETAYVTQKQLIISNRKDKFEQLAKMNFYGFKIPERERRMMENEVSEDWAKIYKTEFVVYEVLKIRDDVAVVFSLRQFDKLYDANLFKKKDDGLWYNCGNLQSFSIDGMVNDVKRAFRAFLHSPVTSIKDKLKLIDKESYRVDKKIIDFPEKLDLSTPENAYATQKRLIVSNRKDKIEQLVKLNYKRNEISERERSRIEDELPEDFVKMYKTELVVYEVIKLRDDIAFVFALQKLGNLYDGNIFQKKDDGLWYNHENLQSSDPDEMVEQVKRAITLLN